MTAARGDLAGKRREIPRTLTIESPRVEDGAAVWRIARDSEVLDLNSSYSYLLWCRDFAATSVVARGAESPVAFVTGYVRPEHPRTLVVWQVAVDRTYRGTGLAGIMLDELTARVTGKLGVTWIETTVTPDNIASDRMFTAYAARHSAALEREVLFAGGLFPGEAHQPEVLYRIGPLSS
jgi:L-2,4-diaminobutyric acid acetyltransferase